MTLSMAFFVLLFFGLLFFGIFVTVWRIRYECIRSRKANEAILEILTPQTLPGMTNKKSLEHYQHFFGGK